MMKLAWLAVAGAIGTLARFGASSLMQRLFSESPIPIGTLVVNVLGCLLFGLVSSLAQQKLLITPQTQLLLLTGFMGAFTTFSTFASDTGNLMAESQWHWAALNIIAQNVLGLLALFGGFALAKLF